MDISPVTPASWLKSLPLDPKDEGFLDVLLDVRQEMIDLDVIVTVLDLVETHNPLLKNDPRMTFLHLVAEYHVGVKLGTNDDGDWLRLGYRFARFDHAYACDVLDAYLPNYALLCYRNAGDKNTDQLIPPLFQKAAEAMTKLTEHRRYEALGYLHLNVARWQLGHGATEEALAHWQSAAKFRAKWFKALDPKTCRPRTRLAAAKQVWRARTEFLRRFPHCDIDDCGVPGDVYGVILTEFGEDALNGSASSKK